MEQLRLFTGGHIFHAEDFTHLQTGVKRILSQIITELKTNDQTLVRLDGGEKSGTAPAETWTEGWIWFNNDFYYLPQETAPTDVTLISFDIVETPIAGNPVTYRDGSQNNVHIINTLQRREDLSGVVLATQIFENGNRYSAQLRDKLIQERNLIGSLLDNNLRQDINSNGWEDLQTAGGSLETGISEDAQEPINIRRGGGFIELRGTVINSSAGTSKQIMTLPVGYRPDDNKVFSFAVRGLTNNLCTLSIRTTGAVVAENFTDDGDPNDRLTFDNIKFYKP